MPYICNLSFLFACSSAASNLSLLRPFSSRSQNNKSENVFPFSALFKDALLYFEIEIEVVGPAAALGSPKFCKIFGLFKSNLFSQVWPSQDNGSREKDRTL
jgi:hypothetical protein